MLRVLKKQDQRSRIMSKNGTLRTEGFVVGKLDKYLKDIFNSILDLVRLQGGLTNKLKLFSLDKINKVFKNFEF